MEEEIKGKGFVIKDRRQFDEKGDPRKSEEETAPRKEGPEGPRAEQAAGQKAEPGPETGSSQETGTGRPRRGEADYPPVTFSDFVVSLSTSVIYHFGDIPDPVSGKAEKNLVAAKQTIDILGILEQKTRGNLDENEKKLMEAILFELRMRYVKEKEKA
ncbi:MAG: DUF1844 domain-containing protein [Syntrophaceae bacterium]